MCLEDDNKAKDAASAEGDLNQPTQGEQVEGGSKMQGEGGAEVRLILPVLHEGGHIDQLRKDTREDKSLEAWKALADRGERGGWSGEMIFS